MSSFVYCFIFTLFLDNIAFFLFFFFSSRRRHTILTCDWSSDVCSSDLGLRHAAPAGLRERIAGSLDDKAEPRPKAAPAPRRPAAWLAGGAFTALAASLALVFALPELTKIGRASCRGERRARGVAGHEEK